MVGLKQEYDSLSNDGFRVLAVAPENTDDPLFMRGRELGEQRCLIRCLAQFGVGHFLHVATPDQTNKLELPPNVSRGLLGTMPSRRGKPEASSKIQLDG